MSRPDQNPASTNTGSRLRTKPVPWAGLSQTVRSADYGDEVMRLHRDRQFPNVNVRWRGQQEQTDESMRSIILGFVLVIAAMYLLLTIEFNSYLQPILVLSIIPFGSIGAIAGHLWMQLPRTLFSIFGLIALSGIVVNDVAVWDSAPSRSRQSTACRIKTNRPTRHKNPYARQVNRLTAGN